MNDTCLRFLNLHGAFEDQRQPGSKARDHIDGCPQCRQYLTRKEWERKKEEELLSSPDVEALVAEYARRFRVPFYQRRKFLAAASVLALGALGLGAKAWFGGSGPRTVGSGGSPTPNLDRDIAALTARLDQLFNSGGAPAVASSLNAASAQEILDTFIWVSLTRRVAMIPMVVGYMGDNRLEVRKGAVHTLLQLPPVPIKPFSLVIRQAAAAEGDAQLRRDMERLADRVNRS